MPSISDNLMIASRAIENALTAQSAQKISAKSQTSPHRRKERHASQDSQKKSTDNINPQALAETELTKHIDLRA